MNTRVGSNPTMAVCFTNPFIEPTNREVRLVKQVVATPTSKQLAARRYPKNYQGA